MMFKGLTGMAGGFFITIGMTTMMKVPNPYVEGAAFLMLAGVLFMLSIRERL